MDYLFNLLVQDYQQVALYGVALYLIVFITVRINTFYLKTKGLYGEVLGLNDKMLGLDKRVSRVERLLAKIDVGFTLLNKALLGKSLIDESCYSNDHSPRTVNALGEKLFQESGADNIFSLLKDELILELESRLIRSMLELQGESLNVMLAHWDDPRLKLLQDFAYQHPTYNKTPLTYTDLLFVIALKLRDVYHAKHPDL
jgi:hypothetical protein